MFLYWQMNMMISRPMRANIEDDAPIEIEYLK